MELIRSYGLFWERDEVRWPPGKGKQRVMLGRRNFRKPALRVADVWHQRGLYVLYSNTGPYYVGIATNRALGTRLAEHCSDSHVKNWQRFSWSGFAPVTATVGIVDKPDLDAAAKRSRELPVDHAIRDMEALLIRAMGTWNLNQMNFQKADLWTQVWSSERDYFLGKLDS